MLIAVTAMPCLPVKAETIAQPTTLSLVSVEVYRHLLEADDQLYIAYYNIAYTAYPTTSAQAAYLGRLLASNGTELSSTSPYAFNNSGYGQGIFTIYFPASTAPAWSGNYTMRLEGNPLQTWAGGTIPLTSMNPFTKWSTSTSIADTSTELGTRIVYLATLLNTAWGITTMTQLVSGSTVLGTNGELYFCSLVPSLQTVCPQIFSSASVPVRKDIKTKNVTAATTIFGTLAGTSLDFSTFAAAIGLSTEFLNGMLWTIMWLAVCCVIAWRLKSTRAMLFPFGVAEIIGGGIGFCGLLGGILIGIFGALCIAYGIMWRGSA